ncbi:MAG: hypothetical protein M1820_006442 [Bogoriella megaspora]|nr:MAG: hypothetical protein M1820_006442 [Bogoriella megaspora]
MVIRAARVFIKKLMDEPEASVITLALSTERRTLKKFKEVFVDVDGCPERNVWLLEDFGNKDAEEKTQRMLCRVKVWS